ncbi:MAG: SRPBCC family protein [Actinobacteria bacterium]|nr:SRPBCC family protein [Actinomycetota bacterium]
MELKDTFTVDVPPERLWEVLTDVERIAPCVPGFELEEVEEPDYRGRMKIKVGAIQMQYDATITFAERDDAARRAVLKAKGKERRGPGAVDATTTAILSGDGGQTTASMVTEVQVTGRIAQFGRGIIADVSSRLTEKFVANLEQQVLAPAGSAAEPEEAVNAPGAEERAASPPPPPQAAGEPLDLAAVGAVPVLKRVGPVVAAFLVVLLLLRWRSR